MEINLSTKVGEIVRYNFSTARLFENYNIDFCCGGDISLEETATQEKIASSKLLADIIAITDKTDQDTDYIESLSLSELTDHIIEVHHSYINSTMPFLQQKLQKLCDVHGSNHSELYTVKELFDNAAANLSAHMKKEELILFPYIRSLENYQLRDGSKPENPGLAGSAIDQMKIEHKAEGDRFFKIAEITDNYTVPPDGCNTFEVTYKTLQEFEKDLHRHIHLENNVLFPKSMILENKLT